MNVGNRPYGVAVTPDGKKIYVANNDDDNISVIEADTNMVTATVRVGSGPIAFGQFIGKTAHIKFKKANTNLVPIYKINLQNYSKAWENKGVTLFLSCDNHTMKR